jgi:hypothetical protein
MPNTDLTLNITSDELRDLIDVLRPARGERLENLRDRLCRARETMEGVQIFRGQIGAERDAPLRRFLVFAGDRYYAGGGWRDFIGSYDDLSAAEEGVASGPAREWWHIIDTLMCAVVKKGAYAGGYR